MAPLNKAGKRIQGFAAMNPSKQREIASRGGIAAQNSGHARRWTVEEARLAGSKGGSNRWKK